jgi:eukaryotic-like serine/threonine-protein kinase
MIGRKLGHYEVTHRLGAGGMGEVYQATDLRLSRSVAIKVIPEALEHEPSRLERFQREAKALAALNHPRIAAIYGIEEHDRKHFLVLELVDGETLAERLERGPLAPEEAIRLALQIAEALEAAHEKGIIHRDLKPGNIKINSEGNIKVLDFGLAKALDENTANANLSNSPTISAQGTAQGLILGTAAYMAPEQARGLAADRRSDVWSFGCVLYEMLSGRRAFQGELVSDILASVLARDPDYTTLQSNLHPRIKELLRRCLEKDPRKRWQAVGDIRLELEQAHADPVRIVQTPETVSVARRHRWMLPALCAGAVLLALLSAAAGWMLKPSGEVRSIRRFSHILGEGIQFSNVNRPIVAVSPDGSSFAFVANNSLFLRRLDELEPRQVPGTSDGPSPNSPFFSPDGKWLGYWSSMGHLKKIPIRGGPPVVLCAATSPFGVSWGTDGAILFGQAKGIMSVSEDGGEPELRISTKADQQAYGPQLLPDGRSVLFSLAVGADPGRWNQAQVMVQDLKSGASKVLFRGSDARYVPTGHLVYALGNELFAVPFDADKLESKGDPVPVVTNMMRAINPAANTAAANYSFSTTGLFVHVAGISATANSLVWVDRNGRTHPVENLPRERAYAFPRLSPDGRRVAVVESGDIWVYELERGAPIRLTRDGTSNRPIWDPKGLQIAYTSYAPGFESIFVRAADGSGEARQLTSDKVQHHTDSWSPDGRTIFFHTHTGGPVNIHELSLADGTPSARDVFKSPTHQEGAQLSPDGSGMAYLSNESGQWEAYVTPYPGAGGKTPISGSGSTQIIWARNGELFYRSPDLTRLMAAKVFMRPSVRIGKPELIFESEYHFEIAPYANYDVAADGQRVLMVLSDTRPGSSGPSQRQINITENWFEDLRQRAPAR